MSIVRLQQELTTTSAATLYDNKVNPIQTFSGEGTYLYGDKTRSLTTDNDNLKHVGVVNLVNFLRKQLSDVSRRVLFEINDAATRQSFINSAEPILRRVQAENGISEFTIVCDATNNTASIINDQKFVADIYIKPTKSIQTIQLQIVTALPDQTISYRSDQPGSDSGSDSGGAGPGLSTGGSY